MAFDFTTVEFEEATCFVCKSKDRQKKILTTKDFYSNLPGDFSIVRCEKCGLVFQSPRPKEQFIGHYYPDNLGYFNIPKNEQPQLSNVAKKIFINYYGYFKLGKKNIIDKILLYPAYLYDYKHFSFPRYKENGTVLEIGCSHGLALKKLEGLGWQVKGIEMNGKAAEYAKTVRGLDVETGSIFDFDFEPESFDVIILDMVMEHLYNPDEAIKKIARWLKKDGKIMFSIPYFQGFEFSVFKEYAYPLHLPAHITFFNKRAIRYILKDFKDIHYSFHHFDRDIVASAGYKYADTHQPFYKIIASNKIVRFLLIKPFVFGLSLLGKTSRVTVFATKK